MKSIFKFLIFSLVLVLALTACGGKAPADQGGYVLTTALQDGKLVFVGVGSGIEGVVNPELKAQPGEEVTVTLINGEGAEHDIFLPDVDAKTARGQRAGQQRIRNLYRAGANGAYQYMDSVPGHSDAGMLGYLIVGDASVPAASTGMDIGHGMSNSVQPTGVTVEYQLESGMQDGKMIFLGVGGDVDGKVNPDLKANPGDTVKITLTSGEGAQHNIFFEAFNAKSDDVIGQGNSVTLEFMPDREGTFAYYCTIPGHRQAGMEGKIIVGSGTATASQPQQGALIHRRLATTVQLP